MRFIHTADWQIGKAFKSLGEREPVLQAARLDVIEAIGKLAKDRGAAHVLVAGDVYDTDSPSSSTLRAPLERMRRFPDVTWHLIPGNHDPHRPEGVWRRVGATGLPANIRPHLERRPAEIAPGVVLLPSPLFRKTEADDVTAWMDSAATAEGAARIGLAHGSVTGFGAQGEAGNPIDPARPEKAGLAYLALGDWHRTQRISALAWYSGTPEPDLVDSQEEGQALLVELRGPSAPPTVTPHAVGRFLWRSIEETLTSEDDLEGFEQRLRKLPEPSRTLLRLTLRGSLSLSGHAELEERLAGIEAGFCSLAVKRDGLSIAPGPSDIEAMEAEGLLGEAATRLRRRAADASLAMADRRIAETALIELFMAMRAAKGQG